MPRFTYVSRDAHGQRVTAIAEAPSRQQLVSQLKTQGLTVVEVTELPARGPRVNTRRVRRYGVTVSAAGAGEMSIFWREFATMVAAGLPVVEALDSIAEEMEHSGLRKVLRDVTSSMWEGLSFSQSIARHPMNFSPMVIALMGAAEESGSLTEVSNQLATYLENRDRILHKVRAALTYPIFLCVFFLVVMAIATFWIIPKFREIYEGFGARLPWLTKMVFDINAFLLTHLAWLIAGTTTVILLAALWAMRPSGRRTLDHWALRLPIFGRLLQRASVARFCRTLSVLLSGGIPINRAMEMAEHTSGNLAVGEAISTAREDILKGGKIAPSLRKHRKVFPALAIRMISAGEETGSLPSLLEKVADFYESRVDAALTTINTLIEPVMIVFVGAFALVFVLSMYLPIFKLAATMRG